MPSAPFCCSVAASAKRKAAPRSRTSARPDLRGSRLGGEAAEHRERARLDCLPDERAARLDVQGRARGQLRLELSAISFAWSSFSAPTSRYFQRPACTGSTSPSSRSASASASACEASSTRTSHSGDAELLATARPRPPRARRARPQARPRSTGSATLSGSQRSSTGCQRWIAYRPATPSVGEDPADDRLAPRAPPRSCRCRGRRRRRRRRRRRSRGRRDARAPPPRARARRATRRAAGECSSPWRVTVTRQSSEAMR